MKKTLLIFLLMAAIYHVKAQQFFPVKPADSLTNKLLEQLKGKTNDTFKLLQPSAGLYQPLNLAIAKNSVNDIDRMPIAVLDGNSKMPIAKLGGYYTMPVKKVGTEEVIPLGNTLPGLPTFTRP